MRVSIDFETRCGHSSSARPKRGKNFARRSGSAISSGPLTSDTPSLEPNRFTISMPRRSRNPAIIAGDNGAEPEPMQRNDERSTLASRRSSRISMLSTAGGAIAYCGRSIAICRR